MTDQATAFHHSPEGHWEFHDGREVFDKLPANLYDITTGRFGAIHLRPGSVAIDDIIPLPNIQATRAKDLASRFVNGDFDKSLQEMGLLKKMAMLLWGKPGTSKSVTVYEIIRDAIQKDWIVLRADTDIHLLHRSLKAIRAVEPTRGVIVIWEEFENVVFHGESSVLELLDGGLQIPNVFYLMTTNYINSIPARIFFRMRRIPFQVEFTYPGPAERRAYFEAKIPADRKPEINITQWVEKTDGFSVDQCAQVVLAVFAFKMTLDSVIEDLAERAEAHDGSGADDSLTCDVEVGADEEYDE